MYTATFVFPRVIDTASIEAVVHSSHGLIHDI